MIKTYICGSNLHEQIRNHGDEDSGDDGDTDDHVAVSFASFVPLDSALENDDIEVIALSASQILYRSSDQYRLRGYNSSSYDLLACLKGSSATVTRAFLGKDVFWAFHGENGYITHPDGTPTNKQAFLAAAMDSHGRILALAEDYALRLFETADALKNDSYTVVSTSVPLTKKADIIAGAAHFMILNRKESYDQDASNGQGLHGQREEEEVLALGDNRFFQQGHAQKGSWSSAVRVDFFEGMPEGSRLSKISCGDVHTAFLMQDGALYVSGSDAKGQCGGVSQQEPTLVEFHAVPETCDAENDAMDIDVLDVSCGSSHTIISTTEGIYVTGRNYAGQLGTGDKEDRSHFTCLDAMRNKDVRNIYASGWNTIVQIADTLHLPQSQSST